MNESLISRINDLSTEQAIQTFRRCCGANAWCQAMESSRPFRDAQHLASIADAVFDAMSESDWREAFDCHPKIGDLNSLRMKFVGNDQWSEGEQSGMSAADEETIRELAAGNHAYESRFGFIFIVCATGKSATDMLAMLRQRMSNDTSTELQIAAGEQRKITQLRIQKL